MSARRSFQGSCSIRLQPSATYLRPVLPASLRTDSSLRRLRRRNAELEAEITALRRQCEQAEDTLRQSQKMAAVGQLTSGVAHDFNNLITGVDCGLRLVQAKIAHGRVAEAGELLGLTMTSVAKARALTQRLLAFARRQPLNPEPVAVNRLVAGMEDLIRHTVGTTTDIATALASDQWNTLCDASQLETVLLNLCINARDAMERPSAAEIPLEASAQPERGRLTIETRNLTVRAGDTPARREAVSPGDYVALSVTDTGIGMPPDVVARACDPFFTTKPAGCGTGLGLSQVCSFAEQAGGTVMIDSELGRGTTVTVLLPRYAGAEPCSPPGMFPEKDNGRD